ncbi:SMR family transporter [Rothia halotolerans]|uniref:SMR family transporter n=1 Tax=Rothia halotolerans TaxID=405770 RepID=UPI00101D0AB1
MRPWPALIGAICSEVTGSLCLKAAQSEPLLYLAVAAAYALSFTLLGLTLRAGMKLGIAYGIWGATGVALTAVLSALVFGEPITVLMAVGVIVIVAGVLCVELGSQRAQREADAEGTGRSPEKTGPGAEERSHQAERSGCGTTGGEGATS